MSLGSRNRFFRCLWTKQRIFCGLAIIFFLDTRNVICLFPLVPICYAEWKQCYAGVVLGLVEQARRTTSSWHCPEYVVLVDPDSAFYRAITSQKIREVPACHRYLTRLSRKKDGAGLLALLRRLRLTSGCPWGAGNVSFVVFGRNGEFFVAWPYFFLDTRNVICLFPLVPICYAEWK